MDAHGVAIAAHDSLYVSANGACNRESFTMSFNIWELIAKAVGEHPEVVKERAKTWTQEKCKDMIAVYLCECGHMAWEHEAMKEKCKRCPTIPGTGLCRAFKMHPRAVLKQK